MNEMDAVLPFPRPPGPGHLSAGAAPAGTPSSVGGGGARDLGQGLRVCDPAPLGPRALPVLPAPLPCPPAPLALRNSWGAV